MDYTEFLTELGMRGKGLFDAKYDRIRTSPEYRKAGDMCPICFLCYEIVGVKYPNFAYPDAADMLGLTQSARNYIIDGADNPYASETGHTARIDMLRALSLVEL